MLQGKMVIRIWDVEHGACAMLQHQQADTGYRLAMIDSGSASDWRPSDYIKYHMGRSVLDYLFITNADQDHMSDLNGLWEKGIQISTLIRNPDPPPAALQKIKAQGGGSKDIDRFLDIHNSYDQPAPNPFNASMGGITQKTFCNTYPQFQDTNNLSCAVFIEFGPFKILFPGDLEKKGWLALLELPAFRAELSTVTILVASHHGRENGFCEEVFEYCAPQAVVISDKPIIHNTQQMVPDYRRVIPAAGVFVQTTGKRRHVLTTRRDGWIQFTVYSNGNYDIETEYSG